MDKQNDKSQAVRRRQQDQLEKWIIFCSLPLRNTILRTFLDDLCLEIISEQIDYVSFRRYSGYTK